MYAVDGIEIELDSIVIPSEYRAWLHYTDGTVSDHGRLVRLNDESISFRLEESFEPESYLYMDVMNIPISEIESFKFRKNKQVRKGALIGGLFGALIGGIMAESANDSCSGYFCFDFGATGIFIGAAMGFFGGAVMGTILSSGKKSYLIQGNQGVYEARKLEMERYVSSLRKGNIAKRSYR